MSRATQARVIVRHATAYIGVALATFLLLLKVSALPCPTGGCEAVIFSSYGQILGIPVSAFGLLGWLGLLSSSQRIRAASLIVLSMGTLWFLCVQAFLLHRFCGLCLGHAGMVLLTVFGTGRVKVPALAAGALTGFAMILLPALTAPASKNRAALVSSAPVPRPTFALRFNAASRTVENVSPVPAQEARGTSVSAFKSKAWLGPISDQSAVVVISLTCSHCMDTLWMLTAKYEKQPALRGAKLLMLTGPGNEPVHRHVIAAVLARSVTQGETRGFIEVLQLLAPHRDALLTGNTDKIAAVLSRTVPNYRQFLDEAAALLATSNLDLAPLQLAGTPFTIPTKGKAAYTFDERLF